jgi:hypothetical protein
VNDQAGVCHDMRRDGVKAPHVDPGILLPRYARLFSLPVAFLVGAVSYPLMHIFESWTRYDSPYHAVVSVIFVLLTFFPAGSHK